MERGWWACVLAVVSAILLAGCSERDSEPGSTETGAQPGAGAPRTQATKIDLRVREVPHVTRRRELRIAGAATPGARVAIDNVDTASRSVAGGRFEASIPLRRGPNVIRIRATKRGFEATEVWLPVVARNARPERGEQDDTGDARDESPPSDSPPGERPRAVPATTVRGTGTRQLETIAIPVASVLTWTHAGGLFEISGGSPRRVLVTTRKRRGRIEVPPGRYPNVRVESDGPWQIRVRPRGR